MALDSNAMAGTDGLPLPHYTPFPLPNSAGVNVLSQVLSPSPLSQLLLFPPLLLSGTGCVLLTE